MKSELRNIGTSPCELCHCRTSPRPRSSYGRLTRARRAAKRRRDDDRGSDARIHFSRDREARPSAWALRSRSASRTAQDVFDEVDEALGQNLFRLMREGPDDELKLTENAQPAIMAHSIAVFRVLTKDGGVDLEKAASFVAGHSLGEYSALCAAGSFDLATTAKLLKLRGQAMQQAVPVGRGRDGGAARRRSCACAEHC